MALWKEPSSAKKTDVPTTPLADTAHHAAPVTVSNDYPSRAESAYAARRSDTAESVIGADLTIEGSITGSGNVRLAGRFTGDVTVDGTVTIEPGAKLAGGVRATAVAIAGELEGNVVEAQRVDVLASGVLMGDLKADMLTLAAGSRVRGHVECGWADLPARGRSTKSPVGESASDQVRSITPASSTAAAGDITATGAERATGA